MCGRYTLGDPSPLMRRFGLEEFAETTITPRFNVAPSQEIPIVVQQADGKRELRMAKWGFMPFFLYAAVLYGRQTSHGRRGRQEEKHPTTAHQRASGDAWHQRDVSQFPGEGALHHPGGRLL